MKFEDLFDNNGNCIKEKKDYFNEDGDLIDYDIVVKNYHKYSTNSDIVKLYYSDIYADETHGNYSSITLFLRAFG